MDRSKTSLMKGPKIGLVMTTALASVALSGCTMGSAPQADTSFSKAQVALNKGKVDKAIAHAEAAVLAEPRNPTYRALLGAAYLESGRFASAATSFDDALQLGDTDPRTVLSYALAQTALGNNAAALAKLQQYEGAISPADYGLAIALAGKPERGVHVLTNAVRDGENSAKTRQNLAYTYALAGNWRAARVMAAEDVPADKLDERLSGWAASAKPEDYQVRVASLLNVTPSSDGGQPTYLALSNFPSQGMMVAEAQSQAPVRVASAAPVNVAPAGPITVAPAAEPVEVAQATPVAAAPKPAPAIAAPAPAPAAKPVYSAEARVKSSPVVQPTPASTAAPTKPASSSVAATSSQRRMAIATGSAATHMVQLGAFDSRAVAESKQTEMKRKFPQLRDRDFVITEAKVDGRTYFRLAAAGFGKSSASEMCSTVKPKGVRCFSYLAAYPPAGAVDRGVRIAAR